MYVRVGEGEVAVDDVACAVVLHGEVLLQVDAAAAVQKKHRTNLAKNGDGGGRREAGCGMRDAGGTRHECW